MRKGILAATLFVCGACGGSSSPVTVNGNLAGSAMGAQDAVSNTPSTGDFPALMLFTNAPNTCARLAAGEQPKNAKALAIGIGTINGNIFFAPAASGSFTVYGFAEVGNHTGNVAVAQYIGTDAACTQVADLEGTSGTVTLTRVDANGYAGTFDITFADLSHVTGNFTANKCAALSQDLGGKCV